MTAPESCTVTLKWGDGGSERRFGLALGQLEELQRVCDAGPEEILQRLLSGTPRVQDLRQVIRLGLIGGGMEPAKALAMVEAHVDARPRQESLPVARAVLLAAVMGVPDDPPGKAKPDAAPAMPGPAENSPSPESTPAAP
ncbi:MAG: gene transfer agent family protein [Alphaproteobacteria bacterium]|nr:gene transfer agent family protein [Alphaproteobacteria bacterium]